MSQEIITVYSSLLFQDFDKKILIQLLQFPSVLVSKIIYKSEDFVIYLLRSQFLKELLVSPLDFADSEVVDNYVSLLKVFSNDLTHTQMREFLLENNYSLFTGAMIFFNHSDETVKNTSRGAVLRILTSKF